MFLNLKDINKYILAATFIVDAMNFKAHHYSNDMNLKKFQNDSCYCAIFYVLAVLPIHEASIKPQ